MKKFETLLETALNELRTEQTKRKESENKLLVAELELVNKDHYNKILEDQLKTLNEEKENLEASILEKDQEIKRLEELVALTEEKPLDSKSPDLSQTVERYEQTLNKLLENSVDSRIETDFDEQDIKTDVMNVDDTEDNPDVLDMEEEEYILDESLEELQNEENNIEITAVDVKEDFTSPPVKQNVKRTSSGKDCTICGEIFPTKSLLKEHQKEMDHLPRFECDICLKTFKTKGTCQQHKARIHSTDMPFKCSKCDKRFKDLGSCRRHEANVSVHIRNENIKLNPNLMCNICGKEFDRNRRWCLDQHYLTHLSSKGRFLNLSNEKEKS